MIDRSEAVNLARNMDVMDWPAMTPKGAQCLIDAVLAMDEYIRSKESSAAAYAKQNPLGGPAMMFRAIADRIQAGEDYYAVLADYGLQHTSTTSKEGKCP